MKNNFGYLERGTIIREGTILKVWQEGSALSSLYQVALFRNWNDTFSVEVVPIQITGEADESYTKSDLEDLLDKKMLVIYNES